MIRPIPMLAAFLILVLLSAIATWAVLRLAGPTRERPADVVPTPAPITVVPAPPTVYLMPTATMVPEPTEVLPARPTSTRAPTHTPTSEPTGTPVPPTPAETRAPVQRG